MTTMLPDIEAIVGNYLRNHADVTAITRTVVSRTPASTATPWVLVTLLGSQAVGDAPVDALARAFMQFSCYAGADNSQAIASRLARTVRAVLVDMVGEHGGATITAAPPNQAHVLRAPDDVLDPPRERYIVQAAVYYRAVQT